MDNEHHTTTDEKLDEIVRRLRHLDNRDRLRTVTSLIRSIVWLGLVVATVWYTVEYGDELLKQVTDQAASAAAKYSQEQGQGMIDQMMEQYR